MTTIEELLANPALQSAAIPLIVSFVVTGVFRYLLGDHKGPWLAGAGVGVGIIVTYLIILGLPSFPPMGSGQKVFYILALALVAGIIFDLDGNPELIHRLCLIGFPAIGCGWLAAPRLGSFSFENLGSLLKGEGLLLLLVVGASWLVLTAVKRVSQQPLIPVVVLAAGNLGVGGLALMGGSASISQLAFALAAALGGFAVWNWPVERFAFGSAALFVGAGGMMALVCQILFFTRIHPWPLALLLPILVLPRLVDRIPLRGLKGAAAIKPVILFALTLVFVGIALVATYLRTDNAFGGY